MSRSRRAVERAVPTLLLLVAVAAPRAAAASEITAFVSGASPDAWDRGWGGMLTITPFNVVQGDLELAKQGSDLGGTSLVTLSAKAAFAPSFGRLVPFVGLGVGIYVERRPASDDEGTTGLVFAGAKLKLPLGVVVRAEYQWINLPAAAPVGMDSRYLLGAGIGF